MTGRERVKLQCSPARGIRHGMLCTTDGEVP